MNAIEAQVLSALDGLGATSADVANTLQNKGIRGARTAVDQCAISVYVAEQFPGHFVSTSPYHVHLWEAEDLFDAAEVDVPFPVRAFIAEFDAGWYPELES